MTIASTMSPQEHVGRRINLYRTRQHMTMEALSKKVHISPSTLSKYENAKLSVSVSTLFEIADALNVSITQLVDYQQQAGEYHRTHVGNNFFNRSNVFYMYQYFAPEKKIYVCVLEIIDCPDQEADEVILYYAVDDVNNYTNAEYIYKGTIYCHDLVTNIYCENPYNDCDNVSICAKTTFSMRSTTTGLLLALSQSLRNPYSTKVVFSLNPLALNEDLRNELTITDKSVLAEMKRINALVVY